MLKKVPIRSALTFRAIRTNITELIYILFAELQMPEQISSVLLFTAKEKERSGNILPFKNTFSTPENTVDDP